MAIKMNESLTHWLSITARMRAGVLLAARGISKTSQYLLQTFARAFTGQTGCGARGSWRKRQGGFGSFNADLAHLQPDFLCCNNNLSAGKAQFGVPDWRINQKNQTRAVYIGQLTMACQHGR